MEQFVESHLFVARSRGVNIIGEICGRNRFRGNDFDGRIHHGFDFRTRTHSIHIGLVCRGWRGQSSDCSLCSGFGRVSDSETIDSRDDVGHFRFVRPTRRPRSSVANGIGIFVEPIPNLHILMIDQAGQLDRRITIQSFTTTTDDFGEVVKSFTTLAEVWAKVEEKRGSEGEDGNQIVATKRVEFLIRYRSDINEEMRIQYNNETYKIEAILNADSRKAFQKIVTRWAD